MSDPSLVSPDNIAEGYNLFIGEVNETHEYTNTYGEVHTGDAWKPTLRHYCGKRREHMPIVLIVFGDKTHTDLHGSLSVTLIMFTLTCFNRKARNNPKHWRPLAYILNLSH